MIQNISNESKEKFRKMNEQIKIQQKKKKIQTN